MTLEQKRFIAGLKKHAKPLLNFLAIYENLNFDEDRGEYRCDKDPSIKVYKAKKNCDFFVFCSNRFYNCFENILTR